MVVVLLGGHGARDSLVVAVLMLAALLNTEKWGEGGREARKPKQTEGSYLLGGKSAPEKSTEERGHTGLVSSIGKQVQMACV